MLLKVNGGTAKDRLKAETVGALEAILRSVAGDTPLLLSVVAGGPAHWRIQCRTACRGLAVDDRIADAVVAFFCKQVELRFGREMSAARLLDALEVPTPPTAKEIADAWEVESFSSEEGRRHLYGPDGHPEELIKQLRDVN